MSRTERGSSRGNATSRLDRDLREEREGSKRGRQRDEGKGDQERGIRVRGSREKDKKRENQASA